MFIRVFTFLPIIFLHIVMNSPMSFAQAPTTQKVLITGFYDWRDLGTPPEQTRCRDNPSCRILATEGIGPRDFLGPLAQSLKNWNQSQKTKMQIDFELLPVTWEALGTLPRERYQIVIHLGLGVYDSFHRILIEDGAYNLRKGKDAIGTSRKEEIEPGKPDILQSPPQVTVGIHRALNAKLPKPFHLVKATARKSNAYLCNSTYYEALQNLTQNIKEAHQTKNEAYFLHLPHREEQSDRALSNAVFEVIKALLH